MCQSAIRVEEDSASLDADCSDDTARQDQFVCVIWHHNTATGRGNPNLIKTQRSGSDCLILNAAVV